MHCHSFAKRGTTNVAKLQQTRSAGGSSLNKNRLEAFTGGVVAIIIMVLELKAPHSARWAALVDLAPVISSYVLSFLYIAIYWNNHHHMLHTVKYVNGAVLWANMHLLFWLSLIPFTTAWMSENHFANIPCIRIRRESLIPSLRLSGAE
jgi:uncharacterized membrane protein